MKFGWRGIVGILLSAGFLFFAFRGIELDKFVAHIRGANVWLLVLSALLATGTFPLRALRWRPILDPVVPHIPFGRLWSATAIGMMINNVVPARAGEFARAYAISRSTPELGFPAAFASLAVDRLFDAVVIFLLMFGAMLDPSFPHDAVTAGRPVSSYAVGGVLITAGALVAMYVLILFPAHVLSLYELVARRLAPKLEARGRDALVSLSNGLSVLRTPGRFAAVLGWTIAHWLLNAFAFWVGFRAVGITVSFGAALFLQGLIAVGVAAPQAPGFFGVFESFARVGLALYGVSADAAVSWAIGYHLLSFVPITVMGAWSFVRAGLSLGDIGGAQRSASSGESDPPATAPAAPRP
jgi:uncharacterized protein (TIRG00374 family)